MNIKTTLLFLLFFPSRFSIAQSSNNIDSVQYYFKGKLLNEVPLPAGCGIRHTAFVQLFEVIDTDLKNYSNKYVLIVERCPESKGKGFFRKRRIYKMVVEKNSRWNVDVLSNHYKGSDIPMF